MVAVSGCQVAEAGSGHFAAPSSGTEPTSDPTHDTSEVSDEPEHPDLRGQASCQIDVPADDGFGAIRSVELEGNGGALAVTFELTAAPSPDAYEEVGIAIMGPNDALMDLNLGAVFPGDGDNGLYKVDLETGDILNSQSTPTLADNVVTFDLPAEWFDKVGAEWRWSGYHVVEDTEEDCPPSDSDHLDVEFPE